MDNKISTNKIIADIKATKGNRSGCQGLHSSLESDGYLTSICKWARATSPKRIDALVELIEKQETALISWEKTMMEVCGEDGPASVANEIRALQGRRDTALTALRAQVEQLAAENVGLKDEIYRLNARIADLESRTVTAAATDVLAERQRQITAEGWTPEHDDEYQHCEMAVAAACYIMADDDPRADVPELWPWSSEWWKPTDVRRDLVKAGALILAEIERLDRATGIKWEGE